MKWSPQNKSSHHLSQIYKKADFFLEMRNKILGFTLLVTSNMHYNTIDIDTMLYITYPWLIHFVAGNLYPLPFSHISLASQLPFPLVPTILFYLWVSFSFVLFF